MIEVDHVSKSFGQKLAVNDLSLTVRAGEIYALLGPNGAGKTTTIKMIAGLLRPSKGSLRVCSIDVANDYLEAKRVMGYIPDEPYLYEKLSGREFLEFIERIYGLPNGHGEIDAYVKLFGMTGYIDDLVESYSHGMRQRVVLSATLLHKPKAMVVDEPLVGLDPQSGRLVREIFRKQADAGTSILLSTHVLSIAELIADRIGILSEGRLVAEGSLAELKARVKDSRDLEDVFFRILKEESPGALLEGPA